MKNQWLFLLLLSILSPFSTIFCQVNCIQAPDTVCLNDCIAVSYVGTNSDNASYLWNISCGTISNPNSKNPHEACFLQTGNCSITLITQEPGAGPDTCVKQIFVRSLPTARFVLRTDSVCSGNCLGLRVDFIGDPPFVFMVRDTNGVTTYRSPSNSTIVRVCPTASQTIAIINVEDQHCKNVGIQAITRIKVFPPFKGSIYQQYSQLCSSPPVLSYKWFECNTNNLISTTSCFSPPKEDCYCCVLFNGFCYDTVCSNFKCNLDCRIDFKRTAYVGDVVKIKYEGNGGPKIKKLWDYTIDNINFLSSTNDSLELKFQQQGSYVIQLKVEEGICKSECFDTIKIISRPCDCGNYNKNEITKISALNNLCCYSVSGELASDKCFTFMKVLTNAGTFVNISANTAKGWILQTAGSNTFTLAHQAGTIPIGLFQSGSFCVKDAEFFTVTVYYYFQNAGKLDSCKYQYVLNCSDITAVKKCDSLTSFLELQHNSGSSCCYLLRSTNSLSNYFNKITVITNSGTFNNIAPAFSYSLNNSGSQMFTLSHNSGFIPTGNITPAAFCLNNQTNPVTISILYIRVNGNISDTCKATFRFECPDDGTPKEQCCDSTKANLIAFGSQNQCCWNFSSYSKKSKCFSKICLMVNSGNITGVVANAGWTFSSTNNGVCFIPNGNSVPTGSINPGHFCVTGFQSPLTFTINYYDNNGIIIPDCKQVLIRNCTPPPPCNCDSLDNQIFQTSTISGLCCHNFLGTIPYNNCYTKIGVSINSGSFVNIAPTTGYNITSGGNSFTITHQTGHLPSGNIIPANFCVTGTTVYSITIQYFYIDQNGSEQRCIFSQLFDCPVVKPICGCDSLTTQINQLSVISGKCCYNFSSHIGTPNCFTKISVALSSGIFTNVLATSGYNISNSGNSGFTVTHTSGHIPSGNVLPASFCVTGASLYTITVTYYYTDQNGIEQRCIKSEIFDCPKSGLTCGCDSLQTQINSIKTSPGICCYSFTSQVGTTNCFTKIAVTVTSGAFVNITSLPGYIVTNQGNNSFSLVHNSGYIPAGNITPASFCVVGATVYTITVQYFYKDQNGMEQRCIESQTFDCPAVNKPCNCDSLGAKIDQISNSPGLCCHNIKINVPLQSCLVAMSVSLSNGNFSNVVAGTNFVLGNLNNSSFNIGHTSGFLPIGPSIPVDFCVIGATLYTIQLKFYYFKNGILDSCIFSKLFECKPVDSSASCNGTVCNGNQVWQGIGANNGIVYDLENFQCKLFAAGQFTIIDNQSVSNIAQYDGTNWSNLPAGGVNGTIRCMAVHNGMLYVGGQFTLAGNISVNNIAAWDGTSWHNVGGGVTGINPTPAVFALLSTNNGLVVAGQFALNGSNSVVNNISLWNNSWVSAFSNGLPYPIGMLTIYNNDLYAAGAFFGNPYNCIAKWNGTNWSPLTSTGINLVNNLLYHGVESGLVWNNELLVGGHFLNADGLPNTQHLAKWNGASWSAFVEGDVPVSSNSINDFKVYNGELYVAGEFDQIGSANAKGVARSSNAVWNSVNHPNKVTWALESYDSCGTKKCELYSAGEIFVNRWACVTSTLDKISDLHCKIFPNPVKNELNIEFSEFISEEILVNIKSMEGLKLITERFSNDPKSITIDLHQLTQGIYIVEIMDTKSGRMVRKFTKID